MEIKTTYTDVNIHLFDIQVLDTSNACYILISGINLTDLSKSTLQTLYDATDKIDKYPIRYPTSIYKH